MIYDKEAYLRGLKDVYAQEIREGLGFWAEHGMDWEQGGIVTYLDRDGNWYCDEKQGWFTGRAMYAFARAYSDVYPDPRFLAAAENLYDFMVRRQFDPATGKLYHNMTRGGRPIDSDLIPDVTYPAISTALHDEGFAVMGLSELYRATGRQDVKNTLSRVLDTALFLYRNPRYLIDGTRSEEGALPKPALSTLMTLLCAVQTARACDPEREAYYTGLLAGLRGSCWRKGFIQKTSRWSTAARRSSTPSLNWDGTGRAAAGSGCFITSAARPPSAYCRI